MGQPGAAERTGFRSNPVPGQEQAEPAEVSYVGVTTALDKTVFTWEVVSQLPPDGFRFTRENVLAWVEGESAPRA